MKALEITVSVLKGTLIVSGAIAVGLALQLWLIS